MILWQISDTTEFGEVGVDDVLIQRDNKVNELRRGFKNHESAAP